MATLVHSLGRVAPVVVALVFAGVAVADDIPAGFTSEPVLAQRVEGVAGRPVTVLCTSDRQTWDETVARMTSAGTDASAFAVYDTGPIYLSPDICQVLLSPVSFAAQRSYEVEALGAGIEALAHEAEHVAGIHDEGETECAALAAAPALIRSYWLPARVVSGHPKTRVARRRLNERNARLRAWAYQTMLAGIRLGHQQVIDHNPAYRGPCDATG